MRTLLLLIFLASCKPSIGDHLKVKNLSGTRFVEMRGKLYPIKGSGMGGYYFVHRKQRIFIK